MPPFRFLLSADQTPVTPDAPLWQTPLPASRVAAFLVTAAGHCAPSASADDAQVTFGAYFSAVHKALGEGGCAPLCEALAAMTEAPFEMEGIDSVDIQLLKHGQFYHPSKIVVRTRSGCLSLALNLAYSSNGIDLMPREIAALRRLSEQGGDLNLPRVLAQGDCVLEAAAPAVERRGFWFLSPWCDGFHEFHLTRRTDGGLGVSVWDGATSPTLLDNEQTASLLKGAGQLLATAFNPHTLAHIFPWHHAAGDFVVRLDPSGPPDLRLITVRDHQPLMPTADKPDAALDRLLYGQLLLIVQAALRLRVDRLDGVGDIALHPSSMVAPICRGLLEGMVLMRRRWRLPAELDAVLADYLRALPPAQLFELNQAIQGGFALDSPERAAIKSHLDTHVQAVYEWLQTG